MEEDVIARKRKHTWPDHMHIFPEPGFYVETRNYCEGFLACIFLFSVALNEIRKKILYLGEVNE